MTCAVETVLVGRQAIYDRALNVVAYELLYRSPRQEQPPFADGDAATSDLLVNALLQIGLDRLTRDCPAWVNFTRAYLLGEREIPPIGERIVVEVLEDIPADESVVQALINLRQKGFRIALDDYCEHDARHLLLEIADVIKVDVMACDRGRLPELVRDLRQHDVQLLAEKVETIEDFEACREVGFDLFQGFFLSRPRVISERRLQSSQMVRLQLLAQLQSPEVDLAEVVKIIKRDVNLSISLLRYVNSSATGMNRRIESVQQAAAILGLSRIRQLVAMIALASIDEKPVSLIEDALIRARMCELIGQKLGREDTEVCFTVGLFSSLDTLLDIPLEKVIGELPLTTDVQEALLVREGALGRILNCVLSFERGNWEQTSLPGMDDASLQDVYLDAIDEMHTMQETLTQ